MIIITGHGRFASGLKTSLDLIVGNFDFVKPVDFTEDKSPESIKSTDKKIYVFTDLVGGTPFKVSSELTLEYPNVEVFCGTNLPMLVEATMMLSLGCDIDSESIKESGVNGIKPQPKKVIFTEDGI